MSPEATAAVRLLIVGMVKASAVVCVGMAASRMARSRRLGQRRVWRASFVGIAMLPLLEALLPASSVGSLNVSHRLLTAELGNASFHVPLASVVLGVWMGGTVGSVVGLIVDQARARLLAKRAVPTADERLLQILNRAQAAIGWQSHVRLRITTRFASPAVLGWWKPIVLLPSESTQWADDELFAVLCHELHHIRRADLIANFGERLVAAALWPNPLIHAVRRRAAFHREVAADQAALDAGVSPERFATRMIAIARQMRDQRAPSSVLAFGSDTGFEDRVHALFAKPDRRDWSPAVVAAMIAAFVVVLAVIAAYRPVTCIPGSASARGNATRC